MWELDCEEDWALKNWCCWTVVLEKTLENPLDCKEIQPVHSEGDQPWNFFGRNDAKAETPVLWPPHVKSWLIGKRLWCWEGLGARGEGDDRGWEGWMASLTGWTWVWVNSGSRWWTGRPGMLRFMGSQRVGHDWATDLIWSDQGQFSGSLGSWSQCSHSKGSGLDLGSLFSTVLPGIMRTLRKVGCLDGWHEIDFWSITIQQNGETPCLTVIFLKTP